MNVQFRISGLLVLPLLLTSASAQMVTGSKMPGWSDAFGLSPKADFDVRELSVDAGSDSIVNILLPGERAKMVFHLTDRSDQPITGSATFHLVHYGTAVPQGDVWKPRVFRIGDAGSTPVTVDLPAHGTEDITIEPTVPDTYGGYALVLDIPGHGSVFAATLVRTIAPDSGRVQFPTYALDTDWPGNMNEGVYILMQKLGIKGVRSAAGFSLPDEKASQIEKERLEREMGWAKKHDVTVMLTLASGSEDSSPSEPLGRPRPWLTPDGTMMKTKDDRAWLPQYDHDFQEWTAQLARDYGWPKGNLNAVELWNEPWEGISISGWGADIPRYREIYTHMANGVLEARRDAGVKVLIGGTCSSSNARDKLFSDGTDKFLPVFDFVSVHYQALAADPILEPSWMNRKSDYGPVKVWDTESWIANSEDRVAGVIASMRAQGQSRTAGVFRGNVYESSNYRLNSKIYPVVQAYPAAAAIGATQKFIGQRDFKEILFHNGLPWVFVFDGLADTNGKKKVDDGTIVIVGDLSQIYPPERTLFRSVKFSNHASMEIDDQDGAVKMFDFYGNSLPSQGGKLTVPLNGLGYFLRPSGTPGSFAKVLDAVQHGKITGIDPVEIQAHDMTSPLGEHAAVRLELTNVLNRPVTGKLTAQLTGLQTPGAQTISLAPSETREVTVTVSGSPVVSNTYGLTAHFDAGSDGSVEHQEDMHVNLVAHRTIKIDGDLSDWKGVLPQLLPGSAIGANLTEQAYLPFVNANADATSGSSTVWLAYDDKNFYFAAKITDATPEDGMVRFETRNDDSYFYPNEVKTPDGKTLTWPAGVRHYSYRHNFDDPAGSGKHDNVQIAFNVLDQKRWFPYPPGTMPRFISYMDTDYEYALNNVAPQYGGGVEVWRLTAPGVPIKSFFPREPHAATDGGPVKTAQLVSRREGNQRIVEAAIPWSEIPGVKQRIDEGKTIKFTCRVNDNKGDAHELATNRSVSKANSPTLHDSWQTHWSNEIEFGIEK